MSLLYSSDVTTLSVILHEELYAQTHSIQVWNSVPCTENKKCPRNDKLKKWSYYMLLLNVSLHGYSQVLVRKLTDNIIAK